MKSIFTVILFLFSIPVFAENDSLKFNDQTILKLQKADSLSTADSIQKDFIRRQIEALTANEVTKRKELEKKLNNLNINDSLRRVSMKREIDSLKSISHSYPIIPYKDTVFTIFTKIGLITAKERAELINSRLKDLYKTFILRIDSLLLTDNGQSIDIMFNDKLIMSVNDYDAVWYGKSKSKLAVEYKNRILKDLKYYKENTSILTILKQIGLALLVLVIQYFLIKFVNMLYKGKIDTFIKKQQGVWLKGIVIKDYQVLDDEKLTQGILIISKFARWGTNLLQLYITLPVLFSIFPPTRRLAETLFGYVLSPVKRIFGSFLDYTPNLFTIIVIIIITRYLIKFMKFISNEVENGNLSISGFYPDWARPSFNILRFFVTAFMIVVIFPYLPGSNSPIFQGMSVFIGIIFSLGSSSVISNMVAGLVITYMRPFKLGDRIKIGEITGDVAEKTPFVTRIKTTKNEFITIPNAQILSSSITNYNTASVKNESVILYTTITIGYDVPWRQVHELMLNAANKTQYVLSDPQPFVLQTSLDDFYVSYQLNAFTDQPNKQPAIYSHIHQNIQDSFNEAGVEIMSPHYRGQRDGNTVTIPPNYLPKDYVPPSFRIEQIDKKNIDNID